MDKAWWRCYHGELADFAGERITSSNNCPGAVTKKFSQGKNSGAGAMALAESFGARRIVLLGYDCKVSDGKRHWHGDHPKGLGNAHSLPKWPKQFADMAAQLSHVNIVNASRSSALTLWPSDTLHNALQEDGVVNRTDVSVAMGGSYLILSAATEGSRYVECLELQRAAFRMHEYLGLVVPSKGGWEENTKIKPAAILKGFEKSDVVLWVDADCSVDPPAELPQGEWDVCFTKNIHPTHRIKTSAGFILLRDTPRTRQFLAEWGRLNIAAKKDHPAMMQALKVMSGSLVVGDMTPWLKGRHCINAFAADRGVHGGTASGKQLHINLMPCRYPLRPDQWTLLLKHGMAAHGDLVRISQNPDDSDVQVFWGLKRRWGKQAMSQGKRCLVVERAYLGDRFRWHALGFDGLNGRADFCNAEVPSDRWIKHWQPSVRPWKSGGEYALIIGQVPGDAALQGIDIFKWVEKTAKEASKLYQKVFFRPHPLCKKRVDIPGVAILEGELSAALERAAVVITYNSNTAVDAVMAGVPAIAMDEGSMAWGVTSHSLDEPLYKGDRDDWGSRIAYAQWLPEELKSGEAWAHLRRFV